MGLNQEQFVEWVFVFKGGVEFSSGVPDGDWQERHVLPMAHSNSVIWIEGTLTQTSSSAGIARQPHLPDQSYAYLDLRPKLGKEAPLDFGEFPGCRHWVIWIGCVEENADFRYN